MNNKGRLIETEIIDHINEKKYINKMNNNIAEFIKFIFEFNVDNTEISAKKYYCNYKPDIVITADNVDKYISIKYGNNNSVHQEHIYSFCNFLKENSVSQNILNKLLFFHYNDGTYNNTGTCRKSAQEFYNDFPVIAAEINESLNNKILAPLIDRILFTGEYSNIPSVDYIYHGDLLSGVWARKNEIINYLTSNKPLSLAIHVSKLYYQSLQRNSHFSLKDEFRRYYIQFKWYSAKNDLIEISKKRK